MRDDRRSGRPVPRVLLSAAMCLLAGVVMSQARGGGESTDGSQDAKPPAARQADDGVRPAVNPHWTPTGCVHCHGKRVGDDYAPIPLEKVDAVCLSCHDGRQASREVHPVGRSFAREDVSLPDGWPAPEGRLGCVTCHDLGAVEHQRPGRPARNPMFLRDDQGPPLANHCTACHVTMPEQGMHNPHVMLTAPGGLDQQSCRFCHDASFDAFDRRERTGRSGLWRDEITLCIRCHQRHVDYFDPGHIGIAVPAEMIERMLAVEDRRRGSADHPVEREDGTRRPSMLPLSADNRVMCSTCHNPHQRGVFPEDAPLAAGALTTRPSDDARDRPATLSYYPGFGATAEVRREMKLRGFGKELCSACHTK